MQNKVKKLAIFLSIFLAFFCIVENASAFVSGYTEYEFFNYSGGTTNTLGQQLIAFKYDENNKLVLSFKYLDLPDLQGYTQVLNYDYIYFPRYDNSDISASSIYTSNSGGSAGFYFTNQVKCLEIDTEYINNAPFCKFPIGNDFNIYPVRIGNYISSNEYLTKSEIDTYCGVQDCLEGKYFKDWGFKFKFTNSNYSYGITFHINGFEATDPNIADYIEIPLDVPQEPVDAICGLDDGTTTSQEPPIPPRTLCITGTASSITFNGYVWRWTCYGENGGTDDYCESYNDIPIDAVCGTDNGEYLEQPPENFCETGYLIYPTFVETSLGWTWTCGGYLGGENDYCSAYKETMILPDLPELDDCTLQDIPDRWFCEISNSLKSIFLPDADKINELQKTINRINGRFPFNYLSVASNNFEDLQENTENDTITISLLDNEGSLKLEAIEPLSSATKTTSQGLIVFAFVFWGIGYIKHFFN